jgi:hypothetical protein
MVYVKVQNLSSIAGDADRPSINFMIITPTFIYTGGHRWWLLADTETKTDWRSDGRTGVKSGLQFGRAISSTFGIWGKPERWWGPNQDGQWNLKFGLVWFR